MCIFVKNLNERKLMKKAKETQVLFFLFSTEF